MVNAITLITRYIQNNNIRSMEQWSQRTKWDCSNKRPRCLRVLMKQIKELLIIVSGNDIVDMLKDVLTLKELDELSLPKYKEALGNLHGHYENTPFKQRHNIIRPIKTAAFRYSQVKRLGFRVSRRLWNGCNDATERNLGGGKPIPHYLKDLIKEYLNEKSNVASNRMVKNHNINDENYKNPIPARYLVDNKTVLYQLFPYKNEISKSTFFKYLNLSGEFKKPYRLTDLCEYCEKGRNLKKEITQIVKDENYGIKETYNIRDMISHFKEKASDIVKNNAERLDEAIEPIYNKYKTITEKLADYEAILFHKNIANCQRLAYNNHHKNANELKNKLLIEIDFKQKINISLKSPRQVSGDYYNFYDKPVLRSCLGFGVYYVNENDELKLINFDIISSDLNQKAEAAVRGFRLLRSQQFFQPLEQNEYIVWADCGTHFRNNEFAGYLFLELAEKNKHVNLNFFCDKHGKSNRDAHFSNISRFIEAESLVTKLCSSQDIVNAILNRQRIANESKDVNNQEITYAIALEDQIGNEYSAQHPETPTLTIQNIESYYSYKTVGDEFELATSGLSNEYEVVYLKRTKKGKSFHFQVIEPEISLSDNTVNLSNLHIKKCRINSVIIRIENIRPKPLNQKESRFYEFFSLNTETNIDTAANLVKPRYCRPPPNTNTKIACCNCSSLCLFAIESILHPTNSICQDDILDELERHNHPRSRVISIGNANRQRVTIEAARELADHYIYSHNRKEPVFL